MAPARDIERERERERERELCYELLLVAAEVAST